MVCKVIIALAPSRSECHVMAYDDYTEENLAGLIETINAKQSDLKHVWITPQWWGVNDLLVG